MHRPIATAFVAAAAISGFVFACSSSHDTSSNGASSGAGGATQSSTSTATHGGTGGGEGPSTGTLGSGGTQTSASTSAGGSGGSSDLPGWKLVWSDEFNGPDGSAADPTIWTHDTGGMGFGNQEREYYTPGTDNVFVSGGNLHIVAKAQPADGGGYTCWYGPCRYTSAKLMTKAYGQPSLYQKQFGRFSVRMKIPPGVGLWPAFWMLGQNIDQVNWPTCGEIDVMENVGNTPATAYGTVHGPDAGGNPQSNGGTTMLATGALSDDFHVYSIEWSMGQVRFLLDDDAYFTSTPATFPGTWVFDDQPFYLLLNLAVGGSWPGDPDTNTVFPAEMLVDWVRVYDPD